MESRYFNRELSALAFNSRVLALAENANLPLLERVRFLAIWHTNLDEFFQVRVSGLKEQVEFGVSRPAPDGMTPREQLDAISNQMHDMYERQSKVMLTELVPDLRKAGIALKNWEDASPATQSQLRKEFDRNIYPVLTPLAVDPAHPFPYISDLSLNLAVFIRDPQVGETKFARVKVPAVLPRFLPGLDAEEIVPLEQVIAANLGDLFPGMEVVASHAFRVTRNADLQIEDDEADDLLEAIETELTRRRFGRVVRLEVAADMGDDVVQMLQREMAVTDADTYRVEGPLGLGDLWDFDDLGRDDLRIEPWTWTTGPRLASIEGEAPDLFAAISDGDIVVQHPYESFGTSVEAFIGQAAEDPDVLAIKMSLYRTTRDSPILHSLMEAAERGKQVVALVELKARFDEEANIEWARRLEEAGAHVAYGVVGLKTHAKIALVVRRELGHIVRYAHIGTGNYNEKTAHVYEDIGVFTANQAVGIDVTDVFNYMSGYSRQTKYRRLFVAPVGLRKKIRKRIRDEAAADDGHIVMKLNNLVDPAMIDELYAASQAGTTVELIVRGTCCLRPGVPGLSENITVRSLVGRYLEHSRIFRFGSEERGYQYLTGSADLMPRNLDHRVEVLSPALSPDVEARLQEILDILLEDDELAWQLNADGTYTPPSGGGHNSHLELQRRALERAVH